MGKDMWLVLDKLVRRRVPLDSKLAMVSFTFDDAPLSSFTNGGMILEENGFRGTYYVSIGLIGRSVEVGQITDLKTIKEYNSRGHEIANHTYAHINCEDSSPIHMIQNIRKNKKELEGIMSNNFSYPYGSADASSRCFARFCTSSARGIWSGINRGVIDSMNLRAVRIYNRFGIEKCLDLVKECSTAGGWLIFYTHDVCDKPSDYGCTPAQLTDVVHAVSREDLPALTVQKAMDLIIDQ